MIFTLFAVFLIQFSEELNNMTVSVIKVMKLNLFKLKNRHQCQGQMESPFSYSISCPELWIVSEEENEEGSKKLDLIILLFLLFIHAIPLL